MPPNSTCCECFVGDRNEWEKKEHNRHCLSYSVTSECLCYISFKCFLAAIAECSRPPNLKNYFWLQVVCPHGIKSSYLNFLWGHKQNGKQPRAVFLMCKLMDMRSHHFQWSEVALALFLIRVEWLHYLWLYWLMQNVMKSKILPHIYSSTESEWQKISPTNTYKQWAYLCFHALFYVHIIGE